MKTPAVSRRRSGFTLIELMVAMAVTTIIVTILVSITSVALDTWTRSRSEVRASRQAKAMADTMARDFEAMVTRRGNNFEWLHARTASTLPGPANNQSPNASELVFFTAATDRYSGQINTAEDRGGDVSAVGYQLDYQDPIEGGSNADFSTFVLYRKLVNPDEAFNDLLGSTDLQTAFSSYRSSVNDVENFVCENIYQFTVTFHIDVTRTTGGTSSRITVPVSMGPSAGGSRVSEFRIRGTGLDLSSSPSSQVTVAELNAGRVAAVEVSLTVVSDFGLDQLRRRSSMSANAREELIRQHSFNYSKLVEIPGM